jgi:hypothetical protein
MNEGNFVVIPQEVVIDIGEALGRIERLDRESDAAGYMDTGDAWETILFAQRVLQKCARIAIGEPLRRKYSVHVRLADEIEAADEGEAFEKMLVALGSRDGFEIMGHDIIEEKENWVEANMKEITGQ